MAANSKQCSNRLELIIGHTRTDVVYKCKKGGRFDTVMNGIPHHRLSKTKHSVDLIFLHAALCGSMSEYQCKQIFAVAVLGHRK
jgi:hypothetical protein